MNVVVLQGVASSAVDRRELASGATVWSFDVTTKGGADRSHSVPVSWVDPPARADVEVGADVVVLGTVRRRFFRAGGSTQSRTEVLAESVVVGRDRRRRSKLMAEALARVQAESSSLG
ncbi:MAG: single-stranded DNA-binding protein [Acidimicrobiia bacterium]